MDALTTVSFALDVYRPDDSSSSAHARGGGGGGSTVAQWVRTDTQHRIELIVVPVPSPDAVHDYAMFMHHSLHGGVGVLNLEPLFEEQYDPDDVESGFVVRQRVGWRAETSVPEVMYHLLGLRVEEVDAFGTFYTPLDNLRFTLLFQLVSVSCGDSSGSRADGEVCVPTLNVQASTTIIESRIFYARSHTRLLPLHPASPAPSPAVSQEVEEEEEKEEEEKRKKKNATKQQQQLLQWQQTAQATQATTTPTSASRSADDVMQSLVRSMHAQATMMKSKKTRE